MNKRIFKVLIFILSFFVITIIFIFAISIKLSNKYRPSIYNYESYLAPSIKEKLKKDYNYKEFKEINEFTQALTQDKAIAGVGSDFQTAQLIIEKKVRKVDFARLYGKSDANDWNVRKFFYTENVRKHLENFDNLIYNKLVNLPKHELDSKGFILDKNKKLWKSNTSAQWEHFYDFFIPYYAQDKGVAYNVNKNSRPNLTLNNSSIQELENKSMQLDWNQIFDTLKENKYQHIGWTNAFVDNLMIGAINYKSRDNKNWKQLFTFNGEGKLFDFNENNYKLAIDSFVAFVKNSSGYDIKNTAYNHLSGDGLELLNYLIEPKQGRSDSSVIYNGDALDAYYSEDNFASVEEGTIRFVRPKNNYYLVDGWIISHKLSDEDTSKFLDSISSLIYNNNNVIIRSAESIEKRLKLLEKRFFETLKKFLTNEDLNSSIDTLTLIFNSDSRQEIIKLLSKSQKLKSIDWNNLENWKKFLRSFKSEITEDNIEFLRIIRNNSDKGTDIFSDSFEEVFTKSDLGELINFEYISYTPTDLLTYKFLDEWYFGNDEIAKSIFKQPSTNENYHLFTYPIIENNLRTKIAAYYFEATKS
ncbi:hypothetical protein ACWXVJ_00110 [Mycoplasma sp. 773]